MNAATPDASASNDEVSNCIVEAQEITQSIGESAVLEHLQKLSINGKVDQLRKDAREAVFVAGRMALAGQITVFYAAPNSGKTLLTLKLISEAIANGTAGAHVYHINLDDTYDGLIQKGDLGNRYGFHVLGPEVFTHPSDYFVELVNALVEEGTAKQAVLILDTVKKFVDVMDKKASSRFMTTCRRFTAAGGTLIALAHVNKNQNDSNEVIPAGTSDILDDCDCAYTINLLSEEKSTDGTIRSVEFVQKKARGPVVQSAIYGYRIIHDDYFQMFNSVKIIEGSAADGIRAQKAIQSEQEGDQDMIIAISELLNSTSPTAQKDILAALTSTSTFSRRKLVDCLKRWSCPQEEGGIWLLVKGEANSNCYRLPAPDITH